MKKFTFLLAFILFAFMASAQNTQNLQNKFQQINEKYLKFSKMIKSAESHSSGHELFLKSATATTKLDSTVDLILNLETGLWQNDYIQEFFYDSQLKSTSWVGKSWSQNSKTWYSDSKTELGYNNQGLINSWMMYSSDDENTPITLNGKVLVFYSPLGMLDSIVTSSTTDAGITWELGMKQIYHYNPSKQLIKIEMWIFDEDQGKLTNSMNTVYTYTDSGKIKSTTTSMVIDADEMPYTIIDYNYDGAGKLTSTITQSLSFMTFEMENSNLISYQYNSSGQVSVEIDSDWVNGKWVDMDKIETQYNSAGDASVETNSKWENGNWKLVDKDEYTYGSIAFSDIASPYSFGMLDIMMSSLGGMAGTGEIVQFNLNKQPLGDNYYEMLDGVWKQTGKTTFYYSSGTSTKIDENQTSLFSVYPNPAAESVSFKWNGNFEELTLELYQITGAKVLEQTAFSGKSVSLSNLEGGVYFYKLMDGQQTVHSGKLIKN